MNFRWVRTMHLDELFLNFEGVEILRAGAAAQNEAGTGWVSRGVDPLGGC